MTTHDKAHNKHAQRPGFSGLGEQLHGTLTLPGEPDWDSVRRCWNLAADQRPEAVVEAADVDDIEAVIGFAARAGLRVAPQATGHGSIPLPSLEGAVLLKTSRLGRVAATPEVRAVSVQAGALAGEAARAAGEHRCAPTLGLAPNVGVVGLALAGGIGWLSRSFGLACNNIRSLEVVLASGERRHVDAHSEPELFWALRGGGGQHAVVTELELELHPVPEVSGGMFVWPAESVEDVLEQFRELTQTAPESFSAVFRYLALPEIDSVPAPLRGRRVVAIIAVHLGAERDGLRLIGPLRASGGTLLDTFAPIEPAQLVRVAGDPEAPMPALGDGYMLDRLSTDTAEVIVELIAGDQLAPLTTLELRGLGGALAHRHEGHGALAALDGAYSVYAAGAVPEPGIGEALEARFQELRHRLGPWMTEQQLLSSAAPGTDPALGFGAETWARLERIRDEFDPDHLILANRSDHGG